MTDKTIIDDSAHSILGPSSAERWMNCPGSVLATRGLPDTTSKFAAEGTAAHTVSEWCRGLNVRASSFLGRALVVGEHEIPVDQEMVDSVQTFVDYANEFPGDAWYEAKVCFDDWVPGGFGTADDIRISDGLCVVTDFKHGKGVQVFAENNAQLKMYALGVYQQYRHLYEIKTFALNICQPRLDHIDAWEISAEALVAWADEQVKPAAAKALCAGAPFSAGAWCKFCKAKYTCETRDKWAVTQVAGEFENLDEGLSCIEGGLVIEPKHEASRLPPRILAVLAGVRAWCDDKEHQAIALLQQGLEVGGWKMVEGRSQRQWSLPEPEMTPVLRDAGLSDEQIFTRKLNGPAKVEKLLGKKNRLLATHVSKPPGKPKLASPDDPRPPLTLDVLKEFDDLGVDDSAAE